MSNAKLDCTLCRGIGRIGMPGKLCPACKGSGEYTEITRNKSDGKYLYATYMYSDGEAIADYLTHEDAKPGTVQCREEGGFWVVWHE